MGCLSRGLKWPGCGVNHPPPFSAEVKEREICASIPSLGLNGLFLGDLHHYLTPLFFVLHYLVKKRLNLSVLDIITLVVLLLMHLSLAFGFVLCVEQLVVWSLAV